MVESLTKILKLNMSNSKKKWFVNSTRAESWDGKNGSPNVHTDFDAHETLESARNDIRSRIGHITSNPLNRLEWINWLTNRVEVRFNYQNDGAGTIRQTYVLEIMEIDGEGNLKWIDVGY